MGEIHDTEGNNCATYLIAKSISAFQLLTFENSKQLLITSHHKLTERGNPSCNNSFSKHCLETSGENTTLRRTKSHVYKICRLGLFFSWPV